MFPVGFKHGRITKEDVQQHERQVPEAVTTAESAQQAEAPEVSGSRNKKRERLSRLRRKLAERLVAVKNETAMLTTFNEVNMQPIMELRKKYKLKLKALKLATLKCKKLFQMMIKRSQRRWQRRRLLLRKRSQRKRLRKSARKLL